MREAPSAGATAWDRLRRRARSRRVVVVDESMAPTLRPGDRLLVDTKSYRVRLPTVGEVVVLADPEAKVRWLVKRVSRIDPAHGTVEVRGDAGELARDSRKFGPVPLGQLLGRAYRIYSPTARQREL